MATLSWVFLDNYTRPGGATFAKGDVSAVPDGWEDKRNLIEDGIIAPIATSLDALAITAVTATTVALTNDVMLLTTASTPVDYTDGDPAATGEGTAGKGSLCINRTNGFLYSNTGTKAEPIWTLVSGQA